MPRFDYAIFDGDRFVTNALLTDEQVARMQRDGYKLVRPEEHLGWGVPVFRGRRTVTDQGPFRRRWDRD